MTSAPGLRMGAAEWGMLLALSVLWGGSFFFAKVALGALPPLTVALGRVGFAALALLAWTRLRGAPARLWPARPHFVMGFFNNVVPMALILWAMTRISSGLAAILNGTTPFWGALLAHWLTHDERLTSRKVAGVLLGIAGVAVISGPDALAGFGRDVLAQLAVVGAAASYGIAGVYGRRFAGANAWGTSAGQLTASTWMLLPVVAVWEQPWALSMPGATVWAAIAALALLSTVLGYGLYFLILARAGATNVLLVTFLIPVSALLLGTIVLAEPVLPRQLAGMGVILAGLAVLDGRVLRGVLSAAPGGAAED